MGHGSATMINDGLLAQCLIRLVEQGQFLLLEKLVSEVLAICSEHPSVRSSRVTIDKPHALRFADSVSLTLEHEASPAGAYPLLERAS